MRVMSWLAGTLAAAGFLASAAAQESPSEKPVAPADTAQPANNPLGLTADMTVEQVMERIRGTLGGASPFQAAGPAAVSASPEIRRGDVIVALPVAPRRVGRFDQ